MRQDWMLLLISFPLFRMKSFWSTACIKSAGLNLISIYIALRIFDTEVKRKCLNGDIGNPAVTGLIMWVGISWSILSLFHRADISTLTYSLSGTSMRDWGYCMCLHLCYSHIFRVHLENNSARYLVSSRSLNMPRRFAHSVLVVCVNWPAA